MKIKKDKTKRLKINKGQLAIKIMAAFLAILMILSICATVIYYFYTYMSA